MGLERSVYVGETMAVLGVCSLLKRWHPALEWWEEGRYASILEKSSERKGNTGHEGPQDQEELAH